MRNDIGHKHRQPLIGHLNVPFLHQKSTFNHLLATWTCFSGEEKAFTRNLWITKWDMTVIKTREPFDRFNWNNRTWQSINTNIIFCFTYQPYFEQRYHDQFKCKAGIPWSLDWWRTRFTQGHEIVVQCAQGSSRAPLDKRSLFGFNLIHERTKKKWVKCLIWNSRVDAYCGSLLEQPRMCIGEVVSRSIWKHPPHCNFW